MSVHVIGAGLAGLAAACQLTELGHQVVAVRGRPAGGRARPLLFRQAARLPDRQRQPSAALGQYFRPGVTCTGSARRRSLTGPAEPVFPFRDADTGEAWTLRLNKGALSLVGFRSERRVPGTHVLRLPRAAEIAPGAGPAIRWRRCSAGPGALYQQAARAAGDLGAEHHARARRGRAAGARCWRETLERGGYASLPRWARRGPFRDLRRPGAGLAAGAWRARSGCGERVTGAAAGPGHGAGGAALGGRRS